MCTLLLSIISFRGSCLRDSNFAMATISLFQQQVFECWWIWLMYGSDAEWEFSVYIDRSYIVVWVELRSYLAVRNASIPGSWYYARFVLSEDGCSSAKKKKMRGLVEREEGHVGEGQHITLEQRWAESKAEFIRYYALSYIIHTSNMMSF